MYSLRMEVQLRDHEERTWDVQSVYEAFEEAERNPHVWKISWSEGDRRVRLVRFELDGTLHCWVFDPIERYLADVVGEAAVLDIQESLSAASRNSVPSTRSEGNASE